MLLKIFVTFCAVVTGLATRITAQEVPDAGEGGAQNVQATTGGAWKSWTWNELFRGDCHQINGVLYIYDDGRYDFTAQTWTDHTWGADIWHAYFRFKDANGVVIGSTPTSDSPRMVATFPGGGSHHVDMIVHGHYDFAVRFNDINGVDQWASC